jgi:hypothetical protein
MLKEKIQNSIIVLNKIDRSDLDGGIEEEKKNFENHIKNKMKLNLEDNNICYLSAKSEKYLKERFINFDRYLAYIKWKIDVKDNFVKELVKNMNNDFEINIEESNEEDDEENILLMNNKYLKSEGFTDELNNYDYKYYKNYFDKNIYKIKITNNESILEKYLKNSFKKVYEDFIINNKENNELYRDILNNFNYNNKQIEEKNSNKNMKEICINKFFEKENYLEGLNSIGKLFEELRKIEPEHEFIKTIYNNYEIKKNYIENDYKYTIAVFGNYSTGKSSLLNSLIGFDLIPISSNHCTKIVFP